MKRFAVVGLLVATACGSAISGDSSCADYLLADDQTRASAIREVGLDLGWDRAGDPMNLPNVDVICGQFPDRTLREVIEPAADGSEPSSKVVPENITSVEVTVRGEPLPHMPADLSDDPAVGLPLPTMAGPGPDGKSVVIDGDKAAIIAVVAPWCDHCQGVVGEMEAAAAEAGVEVAVIIDQSDEARREVRDGFTWHEDERWMTTPLIDVTGKLARTLGVSGWPLWIVVTSDGNVAARIPGQIGTDGAEALAELAGGT